MSKLVKLMAVTGPLIQDRRALYVRPEDVKALMELPPEQPTGLVNTTMFVAGFGQPLVVSGAAETNHTRLFGEDKDGTA